MRREADVVGSNWYIINKLATRTHSDYGHVNLDDVRYDVGQSPSPKMVATKTKHRAHIRMRDSDTLRPQTETISGRTSVDRPGVEVV